MTELPSVSNGVQHSENVRNSLVLNYESPALTGELQARINHALKHSVSLRPTLKAQEISQNFGLRILNRGFGIAR
jgi:hypothetical protein